MPKYIDQEALLKDIEDSVVFTTKSGQPSLEIRGANKITARIMAAPAADVVEVRWKPIAGYEGLYEVSTLGQVRNAKGCVMKQYLKRDKYTAYKKVALWKDGQYRHFYVHRLVAEAFIPNPDKLPIVNHKDEDGTNNLPNNLEWCDKSYNAKYGTAPKKISKAFSNKKLTDDHKEKISASMKLYRQKEKAEKGYCDNGRHKGAKMDGKGDGEWKNTY